MVEISEVISAADIDTVTELACVIWNEHYTPLIGKQQVDYMLARFQNGPAVREQIAAGYRYYLVAHRGRSVGYFALVPWPEASSAQLSKIYVSKEQRGRGLGRAIVAFAVRDCLRMGIGKLWLTVNRHNTGSISFYERLGFVKVESIVQEIGQGFVMDDYRMVKEINPAVRDEEA
jgi:ribosomal protein S18 acetylase RimI-like enzyme